LPRIASPANAPPDAAGKCFAAKLFFCSINSGERPLVGGSGFNELEKEEWRAFMQIMVRDNNVDQALRALKKKLQREGVYREMKLRRHYEKPSEKRARERAAAIRRARKLERKRAERDGVR
jgi:small subunit ribosomal protein S21